MGKQSRKKRDERAQSRPARPAGAEHPVFGVFGAGGSAGYRPPREPAQVRVARLIAAVVHSFSCGDRSGFETGLGQLVEAPDLDGWRRATEEVLTPELVRAVTQAWQRGWQPADLVRAAGREFGSRHVRLVTDVMVAELSGYPEYTLDPRWSAQLAEQEAERWWPLESTYLRAWYAVPKNDWVQVSSLAVETLALLASLPHLEQLGPLPGTARRPAAKAAPHAGSASAAASGRAGAAEPAAEAPVADERMLSRIRGLLAKAEATQFPAEAEALTAAAQERMARYSIDAAMLAATAPQSAANVPGGRRIGIDNPYESAKAVLLNAVASANRCRSVWNKHLGFCTVIGFEPDLDVVEALFTSLLIQATTAVNRAGAGSGSGARSRSRAFRQSFLAAYAHRIGERLAEITAAQAAAASHEPGGGNLLPVLASRERAVEDKVSVLFPKLTQRSAGSISDAAGWHSGRGAADMAALGHGEALRS